MPEQRQVRASVMADDGGRGRKEASGASACDFVGDPGRRQGGEEGLVGHGECQMGRVAVATARLKRFGGLRGGFGRDRRGDEESKQKALAHRGGPHGVSGGGSLDEGGKDEGRSLVHRGEGEQKARGEMLRSLENLLFD
eukprot:6201471-Pleurochrysis_carterae.AAC.4